MTAQGRFVWHDLMVEDIEAAKAFYSETIGWRTTEWEDGDPNNPYTMWMVGDRPIGGLMALPPEAKQMGAPPHWMGYVDVQDIDAITNKVGELGGKVLRGPFEIPKVGRLAIIALVSR